MTDLPFIDRPCVEVASEPDAAWAALVRYLGAWTGGVLAGGFARAIGVRDMGGAGRFPDPGSTIRGFRVAAADPPRRLLLEGGHRFSAYELEFEIRGQGGGRSELCATTRAAFPGATGRVYRAAVIGSGAHRVLMRRMFRAIRSRAERG